MVPPDQVIKLLGAGLSQAAVAQALNCEPSYISQLMSNEQFAAKVHEEAAKRSSQQVDTDNKVQDIRTALVDRLHEIVPMMTKPMEILRAFEVVDKASKGSFQRQNVQQGARIVQLVMPERAKVQFTISEQKEVVEIEGRSLAAMPATQILAAVENSTSALPARNATPKLAVGAKYTAEDF